MVSLQSVIQVFLLNNFSRCHKISIIYIFVVVFVFFACSYLIVSFHHLKFVRSIVNYF